MKLIRFKKGQKVYYVPIRYWEPEWPIEEFVILEDVTDEDRHAYVQTPDDGPQYILAEKLWFEKENAEQARIALTSLHNLEINDTAAVWVALSLGE